MIKMSENSRRFLEKHYPELLEETDLRTFQLKLDDFIVMEGLDDDDNMTDFGHEAQSVYDDVYFRN